MSDKQLDIIMGTIRSWITISYVGCRSHIMQITLTVYRVLIFREFDESIGVEQKIHSQKGTEIQERINVALDYLKNVVSKDPKLEHIRNVCKCKHEDCAAWAVMGEC